MSVCGCGPDDKAQRLYPLHAHSDISSPSNMRFRDLRLALMAFSQMENNAKKSPISLISSGDVFESMRDLENNELLSAPIYYENIENVWSDRPFYVRYVIVTTEKDEEVVVSSIRESILRNKVGYITRLEIAVFICALQESKPLSYRKVRKN